jgi:hypothetical protein
MRNKDGLPDVDATLDKLDEMLSAYGVKHSFALPREDDIEKKPDAVVTLLYADADDMALSLIYALFCKVYRNADDNPLAEALARVASRHISLAETMANAKAVNASVEAEYDGRKKINEKDGV